MNWLDQGSQGKPFEQVTAQVWHEEDTGTCLVGNRMEGVWGYMCQIPEGQKQEGIVQRRHEIQMNATQWSETG